MSWNKPIIGEQHENNKRGRCVTFLGIIFAIVLVSSGILAMWFLSPTYTSSVTSVQAKDTSRIPDISIPNANHVPCITSTNAIIAPRKLNYAALSAKGKVVITNQNGRELVMTPRRKRDKPKYAIFNYSSENRIAALMMAEPGTRFFGSVNYSQRFLDDYKKSCEEPIIIGKDDDEYTKALKRDMIAMKIELSDRMHKGENLCTIMTAARNELQRLGQVKYQIERMMKESIKKDAKTESDIDDYVIAANKMLESKGISPIKMNPIIKQSLKRSVGLPVAPLTEKDVPTNVNSK